ncbi:MAG: phospholipid-binding protein MlaC [Candidatus Xenobiia bacterium LiM19]
MNPINGSHNFLLSLRYVALLSLLMVFCTNAFADEQGAKKFIEEKTGIISKIVNENQNDVEKSEKMEKVLVDILDIDWMGKFAVGSEWSKMTTKQASNYLASYRKHIVKIYTSKFNSFKNGTYQIAGSKAMTDNQYRVITIVNNLSNPNNKTSVNFQCKDYGNNSIKIRDLIIEDVSLAVAQRSEFSSIVKISGIDSLIMRLKSSVNK